MRGDFLTLEREYWSEFHRHRPASVTPGSHCFCADQLNVLDEGMNARCRNNIRALAGRGDITPIIGSRIASVAILVLECVARIRATRHIADKHAETLLFVNNCSK